MKFQDFVIQFEAPKPSVIIDLQRRWCTCHCREIWVPANEPWPYFCSENRKMLPAGAQDAHL